MHGGPIGDIGAASGLSRKLLDTMYGSDRYTGSSMTASTVITSPCRMNRIVIVSWSLLGAPLRRRAPALMWVVYATSVLPSHSPVVNPPRRCSAFFDGCGRPSIQIV